jgi:hypothetical protein
MAGICQGLRTTTQLDFKAIVQVRVKVTAWQAIVACLWPVPGGEVFLRKGTSHFLAGWRCK